MPETPAHASFEYDVFLSYSSKDQGVVHALAQRLRDDGLRVWLDAWEIHAGDSIPAKIEEGLESSRRLVLCMSANAFGSDWTVLESQTFRFRDPLNKSRRFLPVRLDDVEPKGSLKQFRYIDWRAQAEDQYQTLLSACRRDEASEPRQATKDEAFLAKSISLGCTGAILSVALSHDGRRALSGSADNTVRLWDVETGRSIHVLEGHTGSVRSVALSHDGRRALSGAHDNTVRLWDVETGRSIRVLEGHTKSVLSVALSQDGRHALSGSHDNTVRLWDVETGRSIHILKGHTEFVSSVSFSPDGRCALSGSEDNTVRLWDVETGRSIRVLQGHTRSVSSVAWSQDGRRALSGSHDNTVRLWDVETGRSIRVLEGHTGSVWSVAWSQDGRRALSGSHDNTVRLWDVETGRSIRVLEGHTDIIWSIGFNQDSRHAWSAAVNGVLRLWDLELAVAVEPRLEEALEYTNAKVLLVGDTGAGKTGLAQRLALGRWEKSDSTVGAWSTQWKLEDVASAPGQEREIWLWDFGGQADQRLIHQLYMDETAVAVLVFDPQKEDLFDAIGQWDRDLARAARRPFEKLLVAGRIDAGGLRASRAQVEEFAKERRFAGFFETSAKEDRGCDELKRAVLENIRWDKIPWRTSPRLFKRLKDEIIRLKDEGRVLLRFSELRQHLELRLPKEHFSDDQLKTVIGLLAGPCVVWELGFGAFVLLQPERLNAYGQAVVQTLRQSQEELGCLDERKVLGGELAWPASFPRLSKDDE